MCELCEKQQKTFWEGARPEGYGLYAEFMAGTCGGIVVWGWYYIRPDNIRQSIEKLQLIEKKSKDYGCTLMIATLKPTEDVLKVLNACEWRHLMDYSTRYGARVEGSLQVWAKEIVLR